MAWKEGESGSDDGRRPATSPSRSRAGRQDVAQGSSTTHDLPNTSKCEMDETWATIAPLPSALR